MILLLKFWNYYYNMEPILITLTGSSPFNYRNNFRTAMHLSCKFGIYDYVKILYEHKADINCVDKKGNMPMNYI